MPSSSSTPDQHLNAFTRTVDYFGPEVLKTLQSAKVAVFGLGGVGSHAACALARNGIGALRLVDFDEVTWSSLNRHAVAVPADVGRSKVQVMAEALGRISPMLRLDCREQFFAEDTRAALLDPSLSFVVDAIDSVTPKVELLSACVVAGIPVISCLGAAGRIRGEAVQLTDLFDTHTCPLARTIRKRLHQQGIRAAIPAIFSPEVPRDPLPPDDNDPYLQRGRRRRRLPSVGVVPGIAGYAAAGYVLRALAGMTDVVQTDACDTPLDSSQSQQEGNATIVAGGATDRRRQQTRARLAFAAAPPREATGTSGTPPGPPSRRPIAAARSVCRSS